MSGLLTTTRLKVARACQYQHHVEYDLGYRPVAEEDVLRFGTLIHRGLEAWWLAWQKAEDERLEVALAAVQGEADPFDLVRAEELLRAYHLRWKDEPYEVLAVEAKFEVELRNPTTGAASRTWRLAGKIDVLVKDKRDGRVLVVEHKTSSEDVSPGSDYWKRLRLDGQVSIYFAGADGLGHKPDACLYDVVGKPGQRPGQVPLTDADGVKIVLDAKGERVRTKDGKKWRQTGDTELGYVLQTRDETPEEFRLRFVTAIAEDPNRYLARGEVVRLEQEMSDAMWDIWQLGVQLREAKADGRHPRNVDACVRYGRTCPYFAVCSKQASLDDPSLYRRIEQQHPELSTQDQPGGAA